MMVAMAAAVDYGQWLVNNDSGEAGIEVVGRKGVGVWLSCGVGFMSLSVEGITLLNIYMMCSITLVWLLHSIPIHHPWHPILFLKLQQQYHQC